MAESEHNGISYAEIEGLTRIKEETFNDGLGARWKFWRRRRYMVVTMVLLGEMVKTVLRGNLSVALFPMTQEYTTLNENGTQIQVRDFDWDVKTRGFLLSVFFYGYLATNIPGGILAFKYGGCKIFGFSIVVTSIATIFIPTGARIHIYCLVALRAFTGMCEGLIDPSMELIISAWISKEERSWIVNLVMAGSIWGHVAGITASGVIGYHWGWEAIFYCTGGVGIIWFVAWIILVKEYPTLDKRISHSELSYIQKSSQISQQAKMKVSSIPLVKIITSVPVSACIIAYIPISWSHTSFITHFPAYMKDVLKLEYNKSGFLSIFQLAIDTLIVFSISPIIDMLYSKKILTSTTIRKIFICGPLITMAAFGFLIHRATSMPSVLGCLICIAASEGLCHIQVLVNILDLAPRYTSLLAGIATSASSICGMIAPVVIGYMTQNKTTEEWHTVFYIQSGICLLGAVVYGIFGSGRLQSWAGERTPCTSRRKLRDTN